MQYIIRVALELDLKGLEELAIEYIEEADRWNNHSFNVEKALGFATFAIANQSHNIFLAIDKDTNKPVGFFWGCITGQIWSDDPIGQEMFLFVSKQARDEGVGKELVRAFIKWCKVSGCKSIHCGAHSGIQNDKPAISMYESLGFKVGGYNFNMKL